MIGLRTMIGLPVAIAAAAIALQTQEPSLAVYVKITKSGGQLDRDPPKDPVAKVVFGNAGSGPMHIHKIRLLANGNEVDSLTPLFAKDSAKYQITSESNGLVKSVNPSKPWEARGRIPYLTVRPVDMNSSGWDNLFLEVLRKNDVKFEVTVSSAASGPLCWVTKKTRVISIISQ